MPITHERGYLIPAIGNEYVACAERLRDSILRHHPGAHITIVTENMLPHGNQGGNSGGGSGSGGNGSGTCDGTCDSSDGKIYTSINDSRECSGEGEGAQCQCRCRCRLQQQECQASL